MKPINWSINVNETEFQELFELYWNTLEGSRERLYVINELNKFVYYYTVNKCAAEFDLASDFFLENMSQMKKIIEEYEPSYHITFLVYLKTKIKRRFMNYRLKVQKIKSYENINEYYEISPDDKVESVFESKSAYPSDSEPHLINQLHACLSMLKIDEEITVKLYFCFPLLVRDFRFLIKKSNREHVFSKYREYREYLRNKIESEKEVRGKIIKKLHLTNIQMRDDYKKNFVNRRKRLVNTLNKIKHPVPLRLIAEIMQTNVTSVHRRIKRAREKIGDLLSDQQYLQFQKPVVRSARKVLKEAA